MTLVSEIETMLELPDRKGINKNGMIKGAIEHYRKDPTYYLDKVVQGDTTFQETYKPITEKYEGAKGFFLPKWFSEEEQMIETYNKEIIGHHNLTARYKSLLANPLSYTAGAGLLSVIIGTSLPATIFLLGMGFLYGSLLTDNGVKSTKKKLQKRLKMLDEKISELYTTEKK